VLSIFVTAGVKRWNKMRAKCVPVCLLFGAGSLKNPTPQLVWECRLGRSL